MSRKLYHTTLSLHKSLKAKLDELKSSDQGLSLSDVVEYLLVQSGHMDAEDCVSNYYATFKKINNQG